MCQSYFSVYINPANEWDIKCDINVHNSDNMPENMILLFNRVEETSSYISTLKNTDYSIKKSYLNQLLSLAQAGLVGNHPKTDLSLQALDKLKNKICLKEGSRIKNKYMRNLGLYVLLDILLLLLFKYLLNIHNILYLNKYINVSIGSLIGTWTSFGARKLQLSFEELSLIEEDGVNKWIRLIYICVCSSIILLFLSSKLIELSIGSFNINSINNSVDLQFLLGIICGLIEYKIGTGVFNKANDILNFN